MFRKNDQHRQIEMFSTLDALPADEVQLLKESWAHTFYQELFCRLDESPFAVLYSDEPSRPNVPVNLLVALEMLKAGFGWSDEELIHAYYFNLQVRYALGLQTVGAGHFELRTLYNFRHRLSAHMQATGENLLSQAFEQVTGEQLTALSLKTGRVRMDSTYVASNIRDWSRLQLLVEMVQRVHRLLGEADRLRYAAEFAPYVQGSSGQYVYRVRSEDGARHMQALGELMAHLVDVLAEGYRPEPAYQLLVRVFQEHFTQVESGVRLKLGAEMRSTNVQAPDDVEATFRRKGSRKYTGYVANVSETCDPDNAVQLIVKVQTEPNVTEDTVLLAAALPDLQDRLNLNELHTDGGYNNPTTVQQTAALKVDHVQSGLRGHSATGLSLQDFEVTVSDTGQPLTITCPGHQQVDIDVRSHARFVAHFNATACAACPRHDQCPTRVIKRKPLRTLYFNAHGLEIARRRRRIARRTPGSPNLRAAIESTIAALKRPFHGKLPVRGRFRVAVMLIASATLVNLRRIHRYLVERRPKNTGKPGGAAQILSKVTSFLLPVRPVRLCFRHPPALQVRLGLA